MRWVVTEETLKLLILSGKNIREYILALNGDIDGDPLSFTFLFFFFF